MSVEQHKTIMINHSGTTYRLEALPEEPTFETYDRLWRIILHHPSSDCVYEQLIRISRLWAYKRKFGCKYSPKIESLIKLF